MMYFRFDTFHIEHADWMRLFFREVPALSGRLIEVDGADAYATEWAERNAPYKVVGELAAQREEAEACRLGSMARRESLEAMVAATDDLIAEYAADVTRLDCEIAEAVRL